MTDTDSIRLLSILTGSLASLVVGAYFLGLFQGQRHPVKSCRFFASMTDPLTRKGFTWALGLPVGWILLYYAFVAHVRFSLGRWPHLGEKFAGRALPAHYQVVELLLRTLVESLWVALIVLVGCLFFPRWRHVSVYALCYAVGVGAAFCAWLVSPFLDWLLG